ncbi:MAG: DEAD/DEAH box helicase family protein [Bacteroidales bacterium]|nr:DEAD/DEAH box helicase family protein [Bacteroidales bacterium]
MELKNYQQHILNELSRFLSVLSSKGNIKTAYNDFWVSGNPSITPFPKSAVEPYKDNVPGAPHLCIKVPTGGGKTFIASAALKVIFDASGKEAFRTVVWLVPSNAILEQTLKNLKDKFHHYRQRIDTDFQNRVEVYSKEEALNGQGFTIQTAREKLSIIVASFDSFRTKNKDGRKVYQENGFLQSFEPLTKPGETTLNNVLRALQPVVIVDESHNATSKLSEDMIKDLNPSFVLDLTATPRQNSNVICFTDALELKKNNMVKLPVIVYNLDRKEQVIDSAISLRKHLEQTAQQYTDRYIRPIVLFQAESKSGTAERETFDKIKQNLIES